MKEEYRAEEPHLRNAATTDGLPLTPALEMPLRVAHVPHQATLVDRRVVLTSVLAVLIAIAAGIIARLLTVLIDMVTNVAFYQKVSMAPASPVGHHLGIYVIGIPAIGGIIVGLMARFGSQAIRGHGIPEAMEQVLSNESRIAPRLLWLKPLSAAIAIGTGGPFGAEGPIIATGGALGSVVGQLLRTTALERKTLLAAGAAAGMAATFGSPVSAVLLAVELLLFEFRPRSIIPVALASVTATSVRYALVGVTPVFPMPTLPQPGGSALLFYTGLGALIGLSAVGVTRLVYGVEDAFERLPLHWMWWPTLGGLAVGIAGYFAPRVLGVGYSNITDLVNGSLAGQALFILCALKLFAWALSLGSGTSGGTLAPLFTIGGSLGALIGGAFATVLPQLGVDARIAALVGMAAMFAGASRALLASVCFAFETTRQPMGLLPLLGGCTASYLVSCLLMKNTIMTEKITRRGLRVPSEYSADFWEQISVQEVASRAVVFLKAIDSVETVRSWLATDSTAAHHQGYPVIDEKQRLVGVITRRDLSDQSLPKSQCIGELIQRPPIVVFESHSLREAADHMVRENVGRLPVVNAENPDCVIGIITRSDLLAAHLRRVTEGTSKKRSIQLFR